MRQILIVIVFALSVSSCGYRQVQNDHGPVSNFETIYIQIFENHTYELGIEAQTTDSLSQIFTRYGNLRPVDDAERAELILSGVVGGYSVTSVSYNAFDAVREYRLQLTIEARLERAIDGKVLWKGSVVRDSEFLTDSDRSLLKIKELNALSQLQITVAEDIHSAILSGF